MTLSQIITLFLAGLLTSNCVTVSLTAIDVSTNGLDTVKDMIKYSLIIFIATVFTTLFSYLTNLVLTSINMQSYLFIAILMISAMITQIVDYTCSKICPLFLKQTYGFVPILCMICFVQSMGLLVVSEALWIVMLKVLFNCLGIFAVLFIIAGIRQNVRYNIRPNCLKENTLNLLILFLLFVAFTAL